MSAPPIVAAPRRAPLRELAFRVLAIALSLVVLEGALRALDLPRYDTCWVAGNDIWQEDAELGFGYAPGTQVAGGVINSLGLRGPVPPRAKPAGTERILYVGDSTAYGFDVADDEAFWSLATRSLAARHPDRALEPLVAAAPGYSSYQSRVLVDRFLRFEPDWVVFYVGAHNDERLAQYYEDADIPAREARRHAAWHEIRTLRAAEFLIDRFGRWWSKRFEDPLAHRRVPPDAFEANLRAMIASVRAAGAQPLVLIPPFEDSLVDRYPSVPVYREILARVAEEQNAPSVALQPIFAAHAGEVLYLPEDDFHPSARGHRLIADAIAQAIEESESAQR